MGEGHGCGARCPSPRGWVPIARGQRGGAAEGREERAGGAEEGWGGCRGGRRVRRGEGGREGDYSSILNQVQG